MSSSLAPSLRSKLYSERWIITAPSHPSVKFIPATPLHFEEWLPIVTNPENNEFQDTEGKVWDEAAVQEWKVATEKEYEESRTTYKALPVLVEVNSQIVGYGGIWKVSKASGSIGVVLNKSARGMGIGKLTVRVLAQLCFDLGLRAGAGTMKANMSMRGLMASLGVNENEHVVELPGRGVVAELGYTIEVERWQRVDMNIEFEERS